MSDLPSTVYTPDSPLRDPVGLIREMFRDLQASRELAWRLFVRDINSQYRQSVLGYVWAFLPPLVTTLTFVFLNSQEIINVRETPIPYPAFVMVGTLLWQTFVDALNSPLKAVQGARSMLTKINFPREALILSGIAEVLFNFFIRMLLFVPVFFIYQLPLSGGILLAPLGVLALLALGLMFGMLLTPFGLLFGDVGRGVTMLTGFWMFLTPVVYPSPQAGIGAWLARWNPVSPVIQTTRDWLTAQPMTHLDGFLLVSLAAMIVLLFGWVLYRVAMPILVERMGG